MELPQVSEVQAAIGRLEQQLQPVNIEDMRVEGGCVDALSGRILAEALLADRDSPPMAVSAMDGYALRREDLERESLPIAATNVAGSPPTELAPLTAIRIFTGAPVPAAADCVIRREDTFEHDGRVTLTVTADQVRPNQNIRFAGENATRGDSILQAGSELTPVAMAATSSFAPAALRIRRRVRVAVLNTGDELVEAGQAAQPWQIRDSNGPTLAAWLNHFPWVELIARTRVADEFSSVRAAIAEHTAKCDAVILTGGVSMGDTDFVPAAIESLGGQIAFHRLPIRPGKPVLGACLDGKLLLGLPGNPVSVAITARIFGEPLLRRLAGCAGHPVQPLVSLVDSDSRQLDLQWYRLISVDERGSVRLVTSLGSGDLVSLARSHGFISVPAGQSGSGPWPLWLW